MAVRDDPRWDSDPSPSWNAIAERIGLARVEAMQGMTGGRRELYVELQLYWPCVPAELQERRRFGEPRT